MPETKKKKTDQTQSPKATKSGSTTSKKPTSASPKKKSGGREPIVNAVPPAPRSSSFVHQWMPYILGVLILFMAVCFIYVNLVDSGDAVGVIGRVLNSLFCGLFGWPAFLIPVVLVNLAVNWKKYVDMGLVGMKLALSFLFVFIVASLVQVFAVNAYGGAGFDIRSLWTDGVDLMSGGVLGGLFGELCSMLLGFVGSLIILIPMILVLTIFIVGTTPAGNWLYIRYKIKVSAEKRAARAAELEAQYAEEDEERERAARPAKKDKKSKQNDTKKPTKLTKEEKRRIREEALSDTAKEEGDRVFTEGHKIIVGEQTSEENNTENAPPQIPGFVLKPADDKPVGIPSSEGTISMSATDEKVVTDKKPKQKTEVIEPVREGGVSTLAEELEQDKDYYNLNDLLSGKSKPKKPSGAKTEDKKVDEKKVDEKKTEDEPELEMGMIVNTEDLSELIESDEEEPISDEPTEYVFPTYDLLAPDTNPKEADFSDELRENARNLMETLASFKVRIKEINYSRGPTITRYELKPDEGVRVRSIVNLVDDIALSLATTGVRIEAPIPGKQAVGVEVPNRNQATVFLRTLIESPTFAETASRLAVCLGADVAGKPIYFNIDKMPHLLIAGATGMGKSVCINSLIVSLLYKAKPDEVKLILIDPKKVEFNIYKEMPHLYVPVVSDPKKAAGVLATAVAEMERRFEMIEDVNVRDITNYNRIAENDPDLQPMPRIVIIIDELADLMMTASQDVETAIVRLAQKARAAGIHLVIGTQRPSVDVITGLIKANVPSRIAFTVASQVDSRTILDMSGAEKLIGRGDMLFAPVGAAKPMRVQGAFVGEIEVEKIVEFIKEHNSAAKYDDEFIKRMEEEAAKCGNNGKKGGGAANIEDVEGDGKNTDPKLRDAIELAIETGKISTSLMQRRLEVGYGRAAKIIDQMEALGYVSASEGSKPRRVLITKEQYMEKVLNDDIM